MKSFFTNLKQRYNIRDYKISLVFLVTLISLVGILMVRSARPDLMNRQINGRLSWSDCYVYYLFH